MFLSNSIPALQKMNRTVRLVLGIIRISYLPLIFEKMVQSSSQADQFCFSPNLAWLFSAALKPNPASCQIIDQRNNEMLYYKGRTLSLQRFLIKYLKCFHAKGWVKMFSLEFLGRITNQMFSQKLQTIFKFFKIHTIVCQLFYFSLKTFSALEVLSKSIAK